MSFRLESWRTSLLGVNPRSQAKSRGVGTLARVLALNWQWIPCSNLARRSQRLCCWAARCWRRARLFRCPNLCKSPRPPPLIWCARPNFRPGLTWLNSDKPLSIKGLRGKVVLLDFWTYGCINCLHIIPDLKKLEAKYPDELVVIGVHSAKFATEGDAGNLRQAVMRYGLEHPVVSDTGLRIWNEYAVRAWPTQVLIDPDGRIVGEVAGEGNYDVLDANIAKTIAAFGPKIDKTPLKVALERSKVAPTPLYFPGKIAASGNRIVVSDSSHNRLVVADKTGAVEAVIGSGEAGLKDGDFQSAQFFNPQGVALDGDVLWVADTNNHAIRRVDLSAKTVTTVAGTGQQAQYGASGGVGTEADLSSPWDVLKIGDVLYIAMAGPHQIWQLNLKTKRVAVFAGSGVEARRDGPRLQAAFAQPSGLASDGKTLFVADSESSTIRAIDLQSGAVKTLAGGDLFDFGDADGRGDAVRLQHPLGVDFHDGALFLTDTYNSKIKKLDPKTGEVTTVFGGQGQLDEPGGLAFDGNVLYVADTNDSAIKTVNLADKSAATLKLAGLNSPQLGAAPVQAATKSGVQILAPGAAAKLVFAPQLPKGYHLNYEAPLKIDVTTTGAGVTMGTAKVRGKAFQAPTILPFQVAQSGKGTIEVTALVAYCNTGQGAVCKVEPVKRSIPFEIRAGGAKEVRVEVALR